MENTKTKTIRIVLVAMFLLVFLTTAIFLTSKGQTAFASAAELSSAETKTYWTGSIDEEFDDSSVIVVMDKRTGGLNKRYADSFFGDFPKAAVEDLSCTSGDTKRASSDSFSQILKIELPEKSKENVINVIRQLEKVDGILCAEPNYIYRPAAQPANASGTLYSDLWGMHGSCGIQAEEAWNMTVGVRNSVRVGVIDSGMDNHPDIVGNRVNEGGDFVNMTGSIFNRQPGSLRNDPDGHGTHVAGTIGATGTTENGIVGVAWNVQLIPLQVSYWDADESDWLWSTDAIVRAINWAGNNSIDIINFSGGGGGNSSAFRNAIRDNFSGLFVAAAGNGGADRVGDNNDVTSYYPSDWSRGQNFSNRFISVGAINDAGNRPGFSNWGASSVSIFAPGVDILSSLPATINASGYGSWQGTSMATPHVTGTAVLMFTYYSHMFDGLTRSQMAANIKTAIINGAVVDSGAPLNGMCVAGGRLNALNALCNITFNTTKLSSTTIRIDSLKHGFWGYFPIPSEMYGRAVTQIGNWAFYNQGNISGIDIPNTVTHIGSNAFQDCSYMTDIDFESGSVLTSIGNAAFYNCGSLESITIPGGVTSIGANTFQNCYGLESVYFLSSGTMSNIGNSAFNACASLSTITIPSTVTTIGANAFQGCVALSKVSFSSGSQLSRIENAAFYNCGALTSFGFPASLTYIGYDAFSSCSLLDTCTVSNNLASICSNAFAGCSKLTLYTARTSAPIGWLSNWNSAARPVAWGCNLSSDYVVSFTKSASNPTNSTAINGISNPYRSGYSFGGWYTASDYSGTQYMDLATAPNGLLYAQWNKNSCVAEGTEITLADGRQIAVEDLTGNENLLVWNMLTGQFDTAPILFVDSDPYTEYEITHLYFSDGTEVKVIDEHGFWDFNLNEYVFLRNDAEQYIGHWFNKQTEDANGNMIWAAVQLTDVDVYNEYTTAWSPVTYGHLCYYVNGMLSMPGATEGFINIFEVNPATMAYDTVAMAEDIAEYGLYTYEEFAELIPIPEEIFNAFNGQYLKVSIGKGLIDMDGIAALVERYAPFFATEEAPAENDVDQEESRHDNGNHYGRDNGNHYGRDNGNHYGHKNGSHGNGKNK